MIASAGLTGQSLDSYHVGFLLAPRFNASGRMGHARLAVEMLTRADQPKAEEIAVYLETQNKARKEMEKRILQSAIEQVETNGFDKDDCRAIVLASDDWHPGVIGIVASRIVKRYNRPAVMIALSNTNGQSTGQGSGRSINGFHLANAFNACSQHLLAHGGHEMAAGLKIDSSSVESFRQSFAEHARDRVSLEMLMPELFLEVSAQLPQITAALVGDLQRLGPFGHGNRKPLFACRGVQVAGPPRRVGRTGEHLQLTVRQGETDLRCIGFHYGDWSDKLRSGMTLDLAVEPAINTYNGRTNVELELRDLILAGD